jgi:hypothetical protein
MEIEEQAGNGVISVPDPGLNRRCTPRFALETEARLLLVGHGRSINCRVLDLSLKGCRVQTGGESLAGVHVLVEVTFTVNKIPLRLAGVIRRSKGEDEVGIEFAALSERRMAEWAGVVNEVRAIAALKAEEDAARARDEAVKAEEEAAKAAEQAQDDADNLYPLDETVA